MSMSGEPGASIVLEETSSFYGEVVGLSRVTVSFGPGITGVVGPNGSGKTTLMRVLTGLVAPSEGRVLVLGRAPFEDAATRGRIGFVPATECFFPAVSGRRNLELAFMARGRSGREVREHAMRALETVGLSGDGERRYGTWSRGMRQRLKLGLALTADVDVVLLDEPFLGVDPPTRRHLRTLIEALGETGRTVLVSSHVLHEVEALTDQVAILAHGRLLGAGQIQALLLDLRDQHPHTVRITAADPRGLAAALVARDEVRSLRFVDAETLELVTDHPERTYRELPQVMVESGAYATRVVTHDDSLDALFAHMTQVGARHL